MSVCHKHSVIGVLDSGVGGLTVASEIIRQLPKKAFIILVIISVARMDQEV